MWVRREAWLPLAAVTGQGFPGPTQPRASIVRGGEARRTWELILVWVKDKEKTALDLVPLVYLHSLGSHELSTALRRHWGHLGALGRGWAPQDPKVGCKGGLWQMPTHLGQETAMGVDGDPMFGGFPSSC